MRIRDDGTAETTRPLSHSFSPAPGPCSAAFGPIKIDLLVIKKDPSVRPANELGAIFRGHNVFEFKSWGDSLTIDDVYKTVAYVCLYKSLGRTVDAVRADDITLTLARRSRPVAMFKCLQSYGFSYERVLPGLYRIEGLPFPTQVIVTRELNPDDHIWLACMTNDLEVERFRKLVSAGIQFEDQRERVLVDSVMNAVTLANNDIVIDLMEEDDMYKTLFQLMQPEVDAVVAKAKMEAVAEAAAEAAVKGMEKGMLENSRATIRRMLDRGGFSNSDIAELVGTSEEEVLLVASGKVPQYA